MYNAKLRIMNILRTVTLDRINRKKDKSVSLTFITTTEQTSEQFMELDKELDQSGVLYFKPKGLLTTAEAEKLNKLIEKTDELNGEVFEEILDAVEDHIAEIRKSIKLEK